MALNGGGSDGWQARRQMDAAKLESEQRQAEGKSTEKRPGRYKIYDRIKDNVSLRTIDIVIAVTAILLIIALVYGIATGTPQI